MVSFLWIIKEVDVAGSFAYDDADYADAVTAVASSAVDPALVVSDVRAFEDANASFDELTLPEAANGTFELGGPDTVSWDDLYERIAKVLHKRRRLVHVPAGLARTGHPRRHRPDERIFPGGIGPAGATATGQHVMATGEVIALIMVQRPDD